MIKSLRANIMKFSLFNTTLSSASIDYRFWLKFYIVEKKSQVIKSLRANIIKFSLFNTTLSSASIDYRFWLKFYIVSFQIGVSTIRTFSQSPRELELHRADYISIPASKFSVKFIQIQTMPIH